MSSTSSSDVTSHWSGGSARRQSKCSISSSSSSSSSRTTAAMDDQTLDERNITYWNVNEFVEEGILEVVGANNDDGATQFNGCRRSPGSFLIYSQIQQGHRQVGICAALAVEDCIKGHIKRHEKVTKDEVDLTRCVAEDVSEKTTATVLGSASSSSKSSSSIATTTSTSCLTTRPNRVRNVDPVMMMYRDSGALQEIIGRIMTRDQPILQRSTPGPLKAKDLFSSNSRRLALRGEGAGTGAGTERVPGGTHAHRSVVGLQREVTIGSDLTCRSVDSIDEGDSLSSSSNGEATEETDWHEVWSVTDEDDIRSLSEAFADIDSLYIADGHHRTAAACRMNLYPEELSSPPQPHTKYLLGILFPHSHVQVLPYNRAVTTLGDKSPAQFLAMVSAHFKITERTDLLINAAANELALRGLSGASPKNSSPRLTGCVEGHLEEGGLADDRRVDVAGRSAQSPSVSPFSSADTTPASSPIFWPGPPSVLGASAGASSSSTATLIATVTTPTPASPQASTPSGAVPGSRPTYSPASSPSQEQLKHTYASETDGARPAIAVNSAIARTAASTHTHYNTHTHTHSNTGAVAAAAPKPKPTPAPAPSPCTPPEPSQSCFMEHDSDWSIHSRTSAHSASIASSSNTDRASTRSASTVNHHSATPAAPTCSGAPQTSPASARRRPADPSPLEEHHISMYFGGRWLDLCPREPIMEKPDDPVSSLDVQVLFERLLRPVLDIECPRTDHRMLYVNGAEGPAGLEARVESGQAVVAFCVNRVSLTEIMRVADAGQLMPPKATFFDPKPLSGLFVRLH